MKNWQPFFLRNYLKFINDKMLAGEERSLYKKEKDAKELKKLKKEILYIADYAMLKFNMLTGTEEKRLKEKKIFKKYPYKYKLVSAKKINQMLEDGKPIYYMVYVKSSTDKYLTIFNGKTGELVYTKYKPISYNLKSKDLAKLAKLID